MAQNSYDYIIIGSRIAVLNAALLAPKQGSVLILPKGRIEDRNTPYAQDGMAAALGPGDSPVLPIRDTLPRAHCAESKRRLIRSRTVSQLPPEVYGLIDSALSEDQAFNDPTTQVLVPEGVRGLGMLRAKAHGVLAGVDVAMAVFRRIDSNLVTNAPVNDGSPLSPGADIASVEGEAASILRAERVALNFLQRMSGIASDTNRYVKAIEGTRSRIVDTRKTAPGHRYLDKYAVRMGGGYNHRLHLADGILIKDNHIQALRSQELGLKDVIQLALSRASHTIKVEVEVESLEEVSEAVEAGAHIIMLDNMPVDMMAQAMGIIGGRAVVEASGGINHETVRAVAATGVDLISIGALTHSTDALDISLDLEFS